MRWAGYVERMGESSGVGFWCGNLRERDHLEHPGVDGRIILRWIYIYIYISVLLTQYCSRDQIEKNEVGGVCRTYGGQ